jgi:hypothetical protein
MKGFFDLFVLIAAEFGVLLPDDAPLYKIQYMASMAENRRNDKIKAAERGQIFVG